MALDLSKFPTVEQLLPRAALIDASWPARYEALKAAHPLHIQGYFLFLLARHKNEDAFAAHLKEIIGELKGIHPDRRNEDLRVPVVKRLSQGDTNVRWNEKNNITNIAVTLDLVDTMEELDVVTSDFGLFANGSATRTGSQLIWLATKIVLPEEENPPKLASRAGKLRAPKPDAPKPDAPKPDAPEPPAPDAPEPPTPDAPPPLTVKVPPERAVRFVELTEKLSPQRPVLLNAMAQFATSDEMALAIIGKAGRKVDSAAIRTVIHGLGSFAKTGRAPFAVTETKSTWYLDALAAMENATPEALLATSGPAEPAPPAAVRLPAKSAATHEGPGG